MRNRDTELSDLEVNEDLATQEQERKTLVELDVNTFLRISKQTKGSQKEHLV